MLYFLRIISILVSETSFLPGVSDWDTDTAGGYRLRSTHRLYEVADEGPSYHGTDRGSGNFPPPVKRRRPREEESKPNQPLLEVKDPPLESQAQRTVIALMAGAVFGVILTFLLGKSVVSSAFYS